MKSASRPFDTHATIAAASITTSQMRGPATKTSRIQSTPRRTQTAHAVAAPAIDTASTAAGTIGRPSPARPAVNTGVSQQAIRRPVTIRSTTTKRGGI
jgi:hypothetical protein